jgi:acyl-CoA synthetase (AMP-forming)/AMP-acid ligase II
MTETEPWSYYPDGSPVYSLADIIRQRAAASPARVALAEPGRLTSFADLDRRSSQVAQALQRKGVAPGDRVAFVGASGPEFAEVLYGTAKCRAVFTAVNNRLSAREVLAILADAEPSILVVDPAAAPLAADAGCDTLITGLDYLAWRDGAPASDPGEMAGPDETALILYTSGTTGTPKGVELTGRNLGCALHELHAGIGLDENSVCAAPIPFFHIAGLGLFLAANLNGGSLLLEQPPDTLGVLNMLVDREVIGCSFLQSYGLTESTGGFTLLGPADHVPDEKYAHRLRSAGCP